MNKIILACVACLMLTFSTTSHAGCEERPRFSHNDGNADIYYYKGQAITVLNNYYYDDLLNFYLYNNDYSMTRGEGYFILFKKSDASLTMIYRTNIGSAAGIYNPNIFKELYRFNTCF